MLAARLADEPVNIGPLAAGASAAFGDGSL